MSSTSEGEAGARGPMTPADLARAVDTVLGSPRGPDAWIDRLALDQAVIECYRRGLPTGGIVPTLRDRLRRHERAAREALNVPVPPVADLPTEEEIRELGRKPVATGTPKEGGDGWFRGSGARRRVHPREKEVDSWLRGEDTARDDGEVAPSRAREGRFESRDSRGEPRAAIGALKALRQWGVRFSGERGSDADAFLERIREGRRLVALSEEDLLNSLPFVLEGVAILWFRAGRSSWSGWAEFESAFRTRFAAPNFQLTLHKEIIRRTQGDQEPVADYVACMRTLFARLDPPWPVGRQLDFVHGNLLPRYQQAVRRREFSDFATLELLALSAETGIISVGNYRPPPSPERSLMPSAAYRPRT